MSEIQWLIAREVPHLRPFARSLLRDATAADDLVQDCVERALRKRHLWLQKGSLRGWLLKMLYNLYLNNAGRRRYELMTDGSDHAVWQGLSTPATQDAFVELKDVMLGLAHLPREQRDAILLVALGDVDYTEAAWILGVPVGTLQSRLARGRESLRRMMSSSKTENRPLRRVK